MKLRRNITVAVLAGAAALAGLAMPATASAADKYGQVQVCSQSNEQVRFYLVGENQHGDWVGSQFWDVAPHKCTVAKDYWWTLGRSVEFHHQKPSTGWRWEPRVLPANGNKNGSTIRLDIG
ncbi:hypothetical protein ABZ896_21980 [Streptomyces sp. NPDC047072]|uniref:hypothetical protein n=1 Tax=Streptomyces sp. NPDC047072 TaxID=3154809 RepID=UPI0033D0BDE7